MKDLKKKLALYMAVIMLFSVIAPFFAPIVVQGSIPQGFVFNTDFQRRLRTQPGNPNPIVDSPEGTATHIPDGHAFLEWRLSGEGSYILTFFDDRGQKIELSLINLDGTDQYMVQYNVYRPVNAAGQPVNPIFGTTTGGPIAEFINVNDPVWDTMAAPTPVIPYRVWWPAEDRFVPVQEFFQRGLNGIVDPQPFPHDSWNTEAEQVRRVNNRPRFYVDAVGPVPAPGGLFFTQTLPNYPNHTGFGGAGGLGSLTDYPRNDHPDFLDTATSPFTVTDVNHFRHLSPSFNISQGEGFSFEFNNQVIHFLWSNTQSMFQLYIEGGLRLGAIHAFDLSLFRPGVSLMRDHFTYGAASLCITRATPVRPPSLQGLPSDTSAYRGTVRYYAFAGFNRDEVVAFPYAQNEGLATTGGDLMDNTRNEFIQWENLAGVSGTDFPHFNVRELRMPDSFSDFYLPGTSALQPARISNGLDIRFNLPVFFDEEMGTFSIPIVEYRETHNTDFPRLDARVQIGASGSPTIDTQSFFVDISLEEGELELYGSGSTPGSGGNYWRNFLTGDIDSSTEQSAPGSNHTFRPIANTDMVLHDVSLLHRAGAVEADRVRVKVGELLPSVLHTTAFVTLIRAEEQPPAPDRFQSNFTHFANAIEPVTTFLNFSVLPVGGRMHVQVVPFNMNMHESMRRPGYYQMRESYGMSATTHHSPGNTLVLFPLATGARFEILHSTSNIATQGNPQGSHIVRSQEVVWVDPIAPAIGLPTNFRIINDLLRPQFPPLQSIINSSLPPADAQNEVNRLGEWGRWVGDLTFDAEWDIGNINDLHLLLDEAEPAGGGTPYIEIDYVLNFSLSPDTNDPSFRNYLSITARIIRPPVAGLLPGERAPLFVYLEGELPITTVNTAPFPDPIVTSGIRLPLGDRHDPRTGHTNAFLNIPIRTDAVHLYRPISPPPPFVRADFRFPNVYFMNVHLAAWRYTDTAGTLQGFDASGQGATDWGIPSLFDYLVLNDMSELNPPPPANVNLVADENPDSPPTLTVSYNIPLAALRTYLESRYHVRPMITMSINITQFEDAAMRTFFPPNGQGQSIEGELRGAPNSHVTEFDWNQLHDPDRIPFALGEVDMSLPAIQNVLRGTESMPSGVVRITNIPILTNSYPVGQTPYNVNLNGGFSQAELLAAVEATEELLWPAGRTVLPAVYAQSINLTNLDENRRYFVFTDIVVHRFVSESALVENGSDDVLLMHPGDIIPGGVRNSDNGQFSILSTIVGGTTVGTPQEPTPDLIYPPAPENLRAPAEYRSQTEAGILWNQIFPAPGDEDYVRIEWEIIRIWDRTRLTDEQMQTRETNLPAFIRGNDAVTPVIPGVDSSQMYAWMTSSRLDANGDIIINADGERERYVYFMNSQGATPVELAVDDDRFTFDLDDDEDVRFTDTTLLPNRLYFYYVRTVRIVDIYDPQLGRVEARSVSNWVELPVTTFPVTPPINLRLEDGEVLRPGMDLYSQVLVSWEHEDMLRILGLNPDLQPGTSNYGEDFEFEVRFRVAEEDWDDEETVTAWQMISANLDPQNSDRIRYLVSGLEPGTVYQMQVRLRDVVNDDRSIWSNTITFVTAFPQDLADLERDIDDWLNFLRRRLEELLRRPYWLAQDTPTSTIMVYRPHDVFRGLMQGSPGNIPLNNTDTNNMVFYLPATIIADANADRRGFYTSYSDLDILFAPLFLNADHNQAVIDMQRALNARGSDLTDYFVRVDIQRAEIPQLFNVPAITRQTTISMTLVATSRNIRSIQTWERNILSDATRIVNDRMTDPVMRQNVRNLLLADTQPEEMLDFVDSVVNQVSRQITQRVSRDMHQRSDGILSNTTIPVTQFDAPLHLVATTAGPTTSTNAFTHRINQWVPQQIVEHHNGRAITTGVPGSFMFTGRVVDIPDINTVPLGQEVTAVVARFGLEDLFGLNVDLQRNATRQMIVGSAARIAGAPHGADPMTWAAANLNVQMSSRNATGLISRQEAIAHVMAVYEIATGTRINTIRIQNFHHTAGMQLDNRYAQAVRAAFELGFVTDTDMNPAGSITIGEFLNLLAELGARVPF